MFVCKREVLANVPSLQEHQKRLISLLSGQHCRESFLEGISCYRGTSAKVTRLETNLLRTPDQCWVCVWGANFRIATN